MENIVRTIEKEIDNYHKSFSIWEYDRSELLISTLIFFEDMMRLTIPCQMAFGENISQSINSNADRLDMTIKWIYECCTNKKDEIIYKLNEKLPMQLMSLLNEAGNYRIISDCYTLWSRKRATVKLFLNNKGVEFSYLPSCDIEMYDMLRGENAKKKSLRNGKLEQAFMNKECIINALLETIEADSEQNTVKYEITGDVWLSFYKAAQVIVGDLAELPNEWKFGLVTLGEIKTCWTILLAYAMIHSIACMKAGIKGMAFNSCVLIRSRDEFIDFILEHCELEKEKIREVVELLTYNPSNNRIDIIWTPFIPINATILAVVPSLLMISNPERNITCLLNQVNQKTYSRLSSNKEKIMLEEFKSRIKKFSHIFVETSRPLPNPLPDMDVVIYDSNSKVLFIAELKWLISSDSIKEVCARDEDIRKGIGQARSIKEYADNNMCDVLNRAYGKQYEVEEVYTCVVTRNNIGTSELENDICVVDEELLFDILDKTNADLYYVTEFIEKRDFLPKVSRDYKILHKEVEYGGYRFSVPCEEDVSNIENRCMPRTRKKEANSKRKRRMTKKSRRKNR